MLGRTIANLTRVVVGFFKAGNDTGMDLLTTFEDLTRRWAAFVNSTQTQNRLKDWFDSARESGATLLHITANLGRIIAQAQQRAAAASAAD